MVGALLYLRLTSLRNRMVAAVLRLRQPKYLAGALAGAAYFYFFFVRKIAYAPASAHSGAMAGPRQLFGPMYLTPMIGAVVLLVLVVARLLFVWLSPEENPGLRFTEADISFLFPAPMTRLMLIQYSLLSSQFTILVSSLFLALIANRWSFLGGNAATHAIGWWVIISTINLQYVGTPLTVAQLTRRGVSGPRRRAAGLAAIGLFLGATAFAAWRHARATGPADLAGPAEVLAFGIGWIDVGPMHWVLAFLKIVFGPFLAPDWRAFFLAMGPALLVLLAHYAWVVRMQTSFEDGSIALAHKTSEFMSARREGRRIFGRPPTRARREPFRLPEQAPPEMAFLWKNLTSTWSGFSLRTLLVCMLGVILACNLLSHEPFGPVVLRNLGWGALVLAGYTLLIGPQYARQDLRSDLSHADILKTYPLPGWRIVLGELLAPVAILGAILWLELLVAGLTLGESHLPWLSPEQWGPGLICIALVAPFVFALQLLIPNAGALLFPAWIQSPQNRTAGIDAVGQRLIFTFGQLLATVIALVPAFASAAILIFATQWLVGMSAAIAVATPVVLIILAGELWIGIWWLGRRFERFDLVKQ
jgi:uncharacterized membrane protein YfbV (UPF0208 family)